MDYKCPVWAPCVCKWTNRVTEKRCPKSQNKTLSVPAIGVPRCSVTSVKIRFPWIKRTFILHHLSYFVLAESRRHTLRRHLEHSWCSSAHVEAWLGLTCPLIGGRGCLCPTASCVFVKGIRLSFVSSCNLTDFVSLARTAAEGSAWVAGCSCQATPETLKTRQVQPERVDRTSQPELEPPPRHEQLLSGCFPTEKGCVFLKERQTGQQSVTAGCPQVLGTTGEAWNHLQVKRPEGGYQQVDRTAGVDNAWATGTHFPLKCHIFGIVTSSRVPVLTELISLVPTLFNLPPCGLQSVQLESPSFALLFLKWKMLQIHVCGAQNI